MGSNTYGIKLSTILGLFVTLVFIACSENESQHQNDQSIHSEETEIIESESGLSLHNGEKWHTNEEMYLVVMESEKRIENFKGTQLEDYVNLGQELESDIGRITSSCTMSGESHDVLHKWLMPHIKLAGRLANSQELSQAENNLEQIKESFESFNVYFK